MSMDSTKQILKRWKMHRNALLELVDKLPDSSRSWRPWEEGMTVTELVHHLAWTPNFFFASIDGREMVIPPVPATLAEARELLKQLTNEHEQKMLAYTDLDLQKNATIELFKITEPGVEILHRMIGHEAHHKGQLVLYARLLGVKPPFYVDLSV